MFRRLFSVTFLCLLPTLSFAQSELTGEVILRDLLKNGPDYAKETAISRLLSMAPNGALTQEMAETIELRERAEARMRSMRHILSNDLNGDGALSLEELDRVRDVISGHERSMLEQVVVRADRNRDGALTPHEIEEYVTEQVVGNATLAGRPRGFPASRMLIFDSDNDGTVTTEDILRTIDQGTITANPQRQSIDLYGCNLPQPSMDAIPLFVGAYEGSAVSSVAVAGPDLATSFASIHIEEGDAPIYLIFSAVDAMVLRFTGATDRIERFVGNSFRGIGVIGLSADVVDFGKYAGCRFTNARDANSAEGIRAIATLSGHFGREVRMFGRYDLRRLSLPSGQQDAQASTTTAGRLTIQKGTRSFEITEDGILETTAPNTLTKLERTLLRYHPDGVVDVAPEDVLALGPVEEYEVLPQYAGLLQLMREGSISVMRDGTYSIDRPIARFPPGVSADFVLRRGVPFPDGTPGLSKVVIEETGECIGGGRCR